MKFINSKNKIGFKRGSFLVEIMVSLSIFTLVAVSVSGALLTLVESNIKAQGLKSVMDNLNVAVENMSRLIRVGKDYKCNSGYGTTEYSTSAQCNVSGGMLGISFLPQDALYPSDRMYYYLKTAGGIGTIYRYRQVSVGVWVETAMTAPEVNITGLQFSLFGIGSNDGQPRVFVAINGRAGVVVSAQTLFAIQTTISQRSPDSNF